MRVRRAALPSMAVALSLAVASPAFAVPVPDYEMPFLCGQQWTGTSRADHSPSPLAVDFNRPGDYGRLVVSAAPGTVTRVADLGDTSYGRYVIVDHGGGDTTLYAHLKAAWVVTGQQVDQGTILGQVGDTGGVSGAHLHFEERLDGTDQQEWFHQSEYVLGTTQASANCPDVPVAGDWDGQAGDEVAVFRRGVSSGVFRLYRAGQTPEVVRFGLSSDVPVTGDWDGDGRTDLGVRRPGAGAFLLRNADGSTTTVPLGRVKDVPVTGDWDGDGRTDVGVWRPVTATFHLLTAAGVQGTQLGTVGAEPVTGDWNGDGRTDLGVFDPATATFTLRFTGADGYSWLTTVPFGAPGDLPVTGDWDGNGTTDVGTWSPGTAVYSLRIAPTTGRTTATVTTLRFGRAR